MSVGRCEVAAVHAFEREPVAGEGVVRLLGDELFQHLTPGFVLFRHWVVSYYTGTRGGVQNRAGAGDSNEAKKRKHAKVWDGASREACQRLALGDDGNCAAGADESARETSWRTGDASGGYGCSAS